MSKPTGGMTSGTGSDSVRQDCRYDLDRNRFAALALSAEHPAKSPGLPSWEVGSYATVRPGQVGDLPGGRYADVDRHALASGKPPRVGCRGSENVFPARAAKRVRRSKRAVDAAAPLHGQDPVLGIVCD